MTDDAEGHFGSWGDWNSFQREFEKLQEEAHALILWPLNAAISHLKEEAEAGDAKLEPRLSLATGDEAEHYAELQHWNWQYFDGQVRFLRNMALVGLLSRLIHSLRAMAKTSEFIAPRKGKYLGSGELAQLWTEFTERFGLDFTQLQESIDYLDRLREVRNQIVHDGGEANPLKPLHKSEILPDGTFDMLDTKFSDRFQDFVTGRDISAEVEVSQEQLDLCVDRSIEIVRWVSEQLRVKELEAEENVRNRQM
jgi:hypothetical protein